MPIRFRCQDCRSRVKVPEGSQGKQVKCPRCGRIQTVPSHQSQVANPEADGLTVHTCVGSMHRVPKRKESLVGAAVEQDEHTFAGGGVPGGLNIPQLADDHFVEEDQQEYMSRKQRRRMEAQAREAHRQHEEELERQAMARDDLAIAESRKRVEDLFATSRNKDFSQEDASPVSRTLDVPVETTPILTAVTQAVTPPKAITLSGGNGSIERKTESVTQVEPVVEPLAAASLRGAESAPIESEDTDEPEQYGRWTLDLTNEAYPFLRIIPWVLRAVALMLIGPAFKAMLVADAHGLSTVVCMLILFAGLAMVVVTWTVGEIATAVRDIALKKAVG